MGIDRTSRAQGCLLGQLAGDALGSLVEFQSPDEIRRSYPDGVRVLADGGTWNTIAGQPTDDSEMALLLARMLVKTGSYDPEAACKKYQYWLSSDPFDCGMTISAGLRGNPNPDSQANGAMMRISPLGIFGAGFELNQVAEWAMQDAALTHPNLICQQANALFTMGIAYAIQSGCDGKDLYQHIRQWSLDMPVEPALLDTIDKAAKEPPADYVHQQGWVIVPAQIRSRNSREFSVNREKPWVLFLPTFDYPLTIKVRIPDAWTDVKGTQNGAEIKAELKKNEGKKFALIQAVPDKGNISIVPVQ